MKIVVASDSYKGCMTSEKANQAIARGILKVDPSICVETFLCGDGGEGTMEAFVSACGGCVETVCVHDAYRRMISASYGLIENEETAIIEVSKVIGLYMVKKENRACMYASSYGVGELLKHALERGCIKIILALGGSSTNDGGMGLLEAIGVRFYDKDQNCIEAMPANLHKIARIDTQDILDFSNVQCIAACDVKNYLLGEKGATYVFGKQKGLYLNQQKKVEKAMCHYVQKMQEIGYDLNAYEGGGAAGGIGAVYMAVLHATMKPGVELLFSYNNIEKAIAESDLVITGEGQSDVQTLYGKLPIGVLTLANKYNTPCICISGALGVEYNRLYEAGFTGIFSVADRVMDFKTALALGEEKLEACAYSVVKTICCFYK